VTLAEQHRLQQLALRAVTFEQLLRIWPAYNPDDIAGSWPAVQEALTALIWLRHSESSALAANFYRASRYGAGITGDAPIELAAPPPLEQLDASLGFVGRFMPSKQAALGRRNVGDVALVAVTGAVTRLVLQGGRRTLTGTIRADRNATGYRRITSGDACTFCQMLASRGAVYKRDTVDFDAHDHCGCSAMPVFTTST
jgi:hypothetical protein